MTVADNSRKRNKTIEPNENHEKANEINEIILLLG
jgi:hypothetical protein